MPAKPKPKDKNRIKFEIAPPEYDYAGGPKGRQPHSKVKKSKPASKDKKHLLPRGKR